MKLRFHKMHGLGNDFIVIDARRQPVDLGGAQVRALCDRREGVGCDQLILIEPGEKAEVRMRIWNPDGKPASACGNAARCVVSLTGAPTIETEGGLLTGVTVDDMVSIELPPPRFAHDQIPIADPVDTRPLPMAWDQLSAPDAVNVGNPHLVFFVDDLDAVPLGDLGPRIETDPAFPDRINVNVAEVNDGKVRLRTWERGAGLTRACGTGACATAVAAIGRKLAISPVEVEMDGGTLEISWAPGQNILMRGPATHVFTGDIDMDALA
ncbi:diaminopimelate epimerase [Sphingomicrobium lutaoense]|uniref:Diaminopimelate epimerase n=1 Tax=Sphingomicrobium lutaoense TaxID=515949 RepID=A0A839Z0T8_9SPHN|nr:diaminopimelate epimerase [Sphingomicrobium lutaoense]MBB3763667.1 diaminopimelate epimerase [Sphingomicrobium lutaoense]